MIFKMADSGQENIRNGLRFFDRTDDLTASKVGLAAREGDEETLRALLASGMCISAYGITENLLVQNLLRNMPTSS